MARWPCPNRHLHSATESRSRAPKEPALSSDPPVSGPPDRQHPPEPRDVGNPRPHPEKVASRDAILSDFLLAAAQATDEREVLEAAARRARDAVGAACSIYRISHDRRHLECIALAGYLPEQEAKLRAMFAAEPWRADEGTMGRAFRSGEEIFRTYMSPDERAAYIASLPEDRREAMGALDMRAIITVPLIVDGERTGLLTIARFGEESDPLTEDDRVFAEELARRASIALGRLALLALSNREARELRLLAEFLEGAAETDGGEDGVLLRLAQAAAAELGDLCAIQLLSADGGTFELRAAAARDGANAGIDGRVWAGRHVRLEGAIDRDVIATGRSTLGPIRAGDLRAATDPELRPLLERDFTSALAVPLRLRNRIEGDILLLRERASPPYDERDRRLVEDLAHRAGLTLERQRAERALRETYGRLEAIISGSPVPTAILDREMRVQSWNAAAEELFGWSESEVVGAPPPIDPARLRTEFEGLRRRVLGGETIAGYEARRVRKDGTEIETASYDAPLRDADGAVTGIALRIIDITARKRLERELRETSGTLTAILNASPLPIVAVDDEMRVVFWSAASERLYGWTADEVLGKQPPFAPADDPKVLEEAFDRVREGEPVVSEARRRTKAGGVIDVRIYSAPLVDDGSKFRGALGLHEDVTERRRLEAELLQAQKMETVGRLAGGVAHDFNNILTAIIGYSEIARSIAGEPEVQSALGTIKAAAERAAGLTQQLLAFSRRQMLQPQVVDANEVVLGMEPILRRLIGEDIELVASVTRHSGSIVVDRTQLEQVILNLAVNARDAMPDGGRLIMRTELAHIAGDNLHLEMAAGDYVVISVTDTGTGMDEETKSHIFEPFFTTKGLGKGTGLGLATTYGIVRQSGGYVWVYSELGRGSTFKLYFPAVGGVPVHEAKAERPSGRSRGRVLLVEDEQTLRDLARIVLSRDGFDVVDARDPAAALSILHDRPDEPFDLLVTDVVMPGMSGIELARRLRELRPSTRVLFMSGYAEDVTDAAGDMRRRFLAKPFTPDTLLRAVDEALAEPASTDA